MKDINFQKELSKKGGLINSLKEFTDSNTLLYMFASVLLNGRDKVSLQLVQMGKRNKIKRRLYKKYKKSICSPLNITQNINEPSDYVWTSWLQGEKNSPQIIKNCIDSIKSAFPNKKVIVVDKENLSKYVDFPDFILEKWNQGIITNAHFSDLVRLKLLIKYGGAWVDSTILFKSLPDDINSLFEEDLFFFQNLSSDRWGKSIWLSSWFIISKKNNELLCRLDEILMDYWKNNNKLIDYFLFHTFLVILLEEHKDISKKVRKRSSSLPLTLLTELKEEYSAENLSDIFETYPIQKITYKESQMSKSYFEYFSQNPE